MKSLDVIKEEREALRQQITGAMQSGDENAIADVLIQFSEGIHQQILEEARQSRDESDSTILASRGVRQLTSQETRYWTKVIDAMKTSSPMQALTDLDEVMPKTTIDAVFEDMANDHPLLSAINFQNTSGMIEYTVNTNPNQLATWDTLTNEIVKELTGGFEKVLLQFNKLSAFLPVAKAMLDLGPAWLDRYVRAVLTEALSAGLEHGIITGTGKNMPIGMDRDLAGSVTGGEYPKKSTIAITDLKPKTVGGLIAGMTKTPNDRRRPVKNIIFIVNPVDYWQKIFPATTVRGVSGNYVNDVLPFPMRVIQSSEITENSAVIGLAGRYFMGLGTAKSGRIEYSDEYRFLEDERVYITKLYGHGEPLDNNAFKLLDITNLEPATVEVSVAGATAGGSGA